MVSIIITTYNSEKTIRRTLHSVFSQLGIHRLFQIEVLVIDDCSIDKTVEIVKTYPVRFFSTKINTGGANAGRNLLHHNVHRK